MNTKGAHLFLEMVKADAADTIARVRLCLVPPKAQVGSFSATLTFDATTMRAVHVDVTGGMQAANANVPGIVRLAGASPNGFKPGPLATISFTRRRGKLSSIRLSLLELSSATGNSVLSDAKVEGYPSRDNTLGVTETAPLRSVTASTRAEAIPRIDSISPRSAHVDPEGVLDMVVYGQGFAATGNTVLFDVAVIGGLASESDGTMIRFMAPTMIPEHAKIPARRVERGKYVVKVRTPRGTSNSATFTARGDDR